MTLQSFTELRQGASPLHQQSRDAGCPWGGGKSWLSQEKAFPEESSATSSSAGSGSKFDHASQSPGMLVKPWNAGPHPQSRTHQVRNGPKKLHLNNLPSEAAVAGPESTPRITALEPMLGIGKLRPVSRVAPPQANCRESSSPTGLVLCPQ